MFLPSLSSKRQLMIASRLMNRRYLMMQVMPVPKNKDRPMEPNHQKKMVVILAPNKVGTMTVNINVIIARHGTRRTIPTPQCPPRLETTIVMNVHKLHKDTPNPKVSMGHTTESAQEKSPWNYLTTKSSVK